MWSAYAISFRVLDPKVVEKRYESLEQSQDQDMKSLKQQVQAWKATGKKVISWEVNLAWLEVILRWNMIKRNCNHHHSSISLSHSIAEQIRLHKKKILLQIPDPKPKRLSFSYCWGTAAGWQWKNWMYRWCYTYYSNCKDVILLVDVAHYIN